jgi:hypothetical protein
VKSINTKTRIDVWQGLVAVLGIWACLGSIQAQTNVALVYDTEASLSQQ